MASAGMPLAQGLLGCKHGVRPGSESYLGPHRWLKLNPSPQVLIRCEATGDRRSPDRSGWPGGVGGQSSMTHGLYFRYKLSP